MARSLSAIAGCAEIGAAFARRSAVPTRLACRLAGSRAAAADSTLAAQARILSARALLRLAVPGGAPARRAAHSGPSRPPPAEAPQPQPTPPPTQHPLADASEDEPMPWPPKPMTPEDDDRPVFDAILPWPVSAALAVAFALASAYVAREAIAPAHEASLTRGWPTCGGVVVRSGSAVGPLDPFTWLFAPREPSGEPFLRYPVVEYAYSPDWSFAGGGGKPEPALAAAREAAAAGAAPFSSSVLYRDGSMSHFVTRPPVPRRLAAFLERYPPGAPVAVAYDPADPSRAALFPGASGESIAWAVPILPFLVLAAFVFGRGAHRRFFIDAARRAAPPS